VSRRSGRTRPTLAGVGRPGRGRYVLLALAVAVIHAAVWLSAWSALFARAEYYGAARVPRMPLLEWTSAVLGAPLFYLPDRWQLAMRAAFGDDSNVLLALATANALLWGAGLAAVVSRARARRSARSI
jgi:hypothetical protein